VCNEEGSANWSRGAIEELTYRCEGKAVARSMLAPETEEASAVPDAPGRIEIDIKRKAIILCWMLRQPSFRGGVRPRVADT
jgi:hypothetical protein